MDKELRFITIGDVHGLNEWMIPLFGGVDRFNDWQSGKADNSIFPFNKFDKIIFVGDYVDAFKYEELLKKGYTEREATLYHKSNVQILHNLKCIIELKKAYPDKVVLLFGNHDMNYIAPIDRKYTYCTGFRPEAFTDLHIIFKENIELFQVAFKYKHWLWSHAGLTKGFLNNCLEPMKNEKYRFYSVTKNMSIVELLNFMFHANNIDLYNVGYSSQGHSPFPSPLWARPEDLNNDPIDMCQIVGHTHTKEIKHFKFNALEHIYIDCLNQHKWLIQKL